MYFQPHRFIATCVFGAVTSGGLLKEEVNRIPFEIGSRHRKHNFRGQDPLRWAVVWPLAVCISNTDCYTLGIYRMRVYRPAPSFYPPIFEMALYQNQHPLDCTPLVERYCVGFRDENPNWRKDWTQSTNHCKPSHGVNRFVDGHGVITLHGVIQSGYP